MPIKELLRQYANGEVKANKAIRMLSGMFNPEHAVSLLSVICQITRVEDGDLEMDLFKEIFEL